ncbi:MAG: UvrD-helicase domain-containing protein [Alphaproteobacteria bacterium GM202ARS2]|nr:UvrD-helicase domain-containing protein [Alphaproteobacteria bacterium GM202ARS2]
MTDRRDDTLKNQEQASDPQISSWVSANAGCGKTHVLVNRLIRLLLAGEKLGGILCLTYTRAAASEMKTRLYQRLGQWQHASDKALIEELREIAGLQHEHMDTARARTLLSEVLQEREGMRIQTIHSFCHHLLARFPIEAGLETSSFDIVEDVEAARMEKKAFDMCLADIAEGEHSDLQEHLAEIALGKAEGELRTLLVRARKQLPETIRKHEQKSLAQLTDDFLRQDETCKDELLVLGKDEITRWFQATRDKRREAIAGGLRLWDAYRGIFLHKNGTARRTKDDVMLAQQTRMVGLIDKRKAYYRDSPSLEQVARHFDGMYQQLKRERGKLDYDDLIDTTVTLLQQDGGVSWVAYKLDQAIRHILVDEAQDTSPRQWELVKALSGDFFSGAGGHEDSPLARTVFAVGDFKQSIYGFQGADPQGFQRAQQYYQERAGVNWRSLNLQHNFRSSRAILDFVDTVMAIQGVNLGNDVDIQPHRAFDEGAPGLVELWRCFAKSPAPKPNYRESWVRADEDDSDTPMTTACLIAQQVKGLIESGAPLATTGNAITPGDIMLLFRARNPLYRQVIQELHSLRVPIAGTDRLQLQNDLAVMDVCALAQWALLPEDDFTLACLLKSPLCGLDEDALQRLAYGRETQSLWRVLQGSKEHTEVCAFLRDMLGYADYAPPFEFFQRALSYHRKRQSFYGTLGVECGDILDELLNATLAYERSSTPSLQGFLAWFHQDAIEIKRDMESQHNKVRLLTIHGAKGLEAPIVILASSQWRDRSRSADEPVRRNGKLLWFGVQDNMDDDSREADDKSKQEGYQEDNRLLYVALTRAQERLYIAGYDRGATDEKKDDEWQTSVPPRRYRVMRAAFEALRDEWEKGAIPKGLRLEEGSDSDSWVWRLRYETKPQSKKADAKADKPASAPLPSWAVVPQRKGATATTPTTDIDTDTQGVPARPVTSVTSPLQDDLARQRGNAVHRVLELLPLDVGGKTPDERAQLIRKALGAYDGDSDEVVRHIQALFADPAINALLSCDCQREVSLMDGDDTLRIHRIDRLIVDEDKIRIIDYKSDERVPSTVRDVSASYQEQLRRYQSKIRVLYPDRACEGYLLWTRVARLMKVC